MGLDSFLIVDFFYSEYDHKEKTIAEKIKGVMGIESSSSVSVTTLAGHWRKANHIHNWFVNNVQNGVDNCGEYSVKPEQLSELKDLCVEVLNNHELAPEKLPTCDGMFFGDSEYNEWYFVNLKNTIEIIDRVFKWQKLGGSKITYTASW